jgi:hypothetical protein
MIEKVGVIKDIVPSNVSSSNGGIYTPTIGRGPIVGDNVVFKEDKLLASKIRKISPRSPATNGIAPEWMIYLRKTASSWLKVESTMVNHPIKPSRY